MERLSGFLRQFDHVEHGEAGLDFACVWKGDIVNSDDGTPHPGNERDSLETGSGDSSSAGSWLAALSVKRRYRYVDLFDEREKREAIAHLVLGGSFLDVVEKANRRLAGFDPEEQALYREEIEREMYFRRAFDSIAERAPEQRELIDMICEGVLESGISVSQFEANSDVIISSLGEMMKRHMVDGQNEEGQEDEC